MLVDMGAARLAATLVRGRVLHTWVSLETAGRRDARRFARFRRGVAKIGDGRFSIGSYTLGSD